MKEKRNLRKKKIAGVLSLVLVLVLLVGGTYAWQKNLLHKTTQAGVKTPPLLKSVQLIDESKDITGFSVNETLQKKISVKNDGFDGSVAGTDRFDDVYVRIALKEYMERATTDQKVYKNRLMIDSKGDFVELGDAAVGATGSENLETIKAISGGKYDGHNAVKLHNALANPQSPDAAAWYVETKQNDPNGEYGNFMTTDIENSIEHIDSRGWAKGSARASVPSITAQKNGDYHTDGATEECDYEMVDWSGVNYNTYRNSGAFSGKQSTKTLHQYLQFEMSGGTTGANVRFMSDYAPGAGGKFAGKKIEQGEYWLIDNVKTGGTGGEMYAYWMKPLTPHEQTKTLTTGVTLVKSPNENDPVGTPYPPNFYYAIHADLYPTLETQYADDWKGMNKDIETTLFPKYFKITFADGKDYTKTTKGSVTPCIKDTTPGATQEYSLDGGATWTAFSSGQTIDVPKGVIFFRGTGRTSLYTIGQGYNAWQIDPASGSKALASGNLNTLLDYTSPPTALGHHCFANMFQNCTSLVTPPELPATELENDAYCLMFVGCTSLKEAPKLPATTLGNYCYSGMFSGCTSLAAPPALPATVLKNHCYDSMFNGCTSITSAPKLPAKEMTEGCYAAMFQDCSSLLTAPDLSSTKLARDCYSYMFRGCTSLESAPDLPAKTLEINCYGNMFTDCKELSSVSVAFTEWKLYGGYVATTSEWLKNTAQSGTFVCPTALDQTRGESNIPNGWTINP